MKTKKVNFFKRVKLFVKQNSYAVVVGCSALLLSLALLLTATLSTRIKNKENLGEDFINNQKQETLLPSDDAQASATAPIVFAYPVQNYTLGNTYSDERLVKNETLNEWSTHLGIDFLVDEGADVFASMDGVVESVSYDSLLGTIVVIDHGNGLRTNYSSLASPTLVEAGQTVKTGEVIGSASTNASELKLGAHVHFEVSENGTPVNPLNYLGEK